MPVIGINITSINARKDREMIGSVKINSNATIKEIKEYEMTALKQKGLSVEFEFKTNYVNDKDKSTAEIVIGGDVLFIDEQIEKVIKEWKRDKKLPEDANLHIMNVILDKCSKKAIAISDDLQLLSPIPLPTARKDASK